MNKPEYIIIHCSDSAWGCGRVIDQWHKERGWSGIGYHFVILNGKPYPDCIIMATNGSIECGRDVDEVGSHAVGYNNNSIGICLVGIDKFTLEQFDSLKKLLLELIISNSIQPDNILGHCETASGKEQGKTCPNFDAGIFRSWVKTRL